ncbi:MULTISPECIES: helix-turn-helix domain-containing protein [Burkholderia]|uniref:helix-turn-helix domain-containing protein n=1 Tax=Burkholderia TaxID=32008 RepID=UPI001CF1A668|nr:helix-turn-helix domain-containing protein [Burkholderia metallica]MCA8003152.1 helix-turn-helix domain-containing protein [Burkholderia metallica]
MTSKKDKGRNPCQGATQMTSKVNHRDMSTAAQRARVLEHLRAGSQTTYSLRRHGISHPAQRVRELILAGHVISSSPVTAIDSDGFAHRKVALYTLVKEVRSHIQEEAA